MTTDEIVIYGKSLFVVLVDNAIINRSKANNMYNVPGLFLDFDNGIVRNCIMKFSLLPHNVFVRDIDVLDYKKDVCILSSWIWVMTYMRHN